MTPGDKKRVLVATTALTIACSSSTTEPSQQTCADRTGTYLVQFTQRSGDCGKLTEQLITLPAPPDPRCTTSTQVSGDNCHVSAQTRCQDGSSASAVATWSEDGSHADATFTLSVPGVCSSSYAVVYERQ